MTHPTVPNPATNDQRAQRGRSIAKLAGYDESELGKLLADLCAYADTLGPAAWANQTQHARQVVNEDRVLIGVKITAEGEATKVAAPFGEMDRLRWLASQVEWVAEPLGTYVDAVRTDEASVYFNDNALGLEPNPVATRWVEAKLALLGRVLLGPIHGAVVILGGPSALGLDLDLGQSTVDELLALGR